MNKTKQEIKTKISTEVAILEQYFKRRKDAMARIEKEVDELAMLTNCIIRQEVKINALKSV